MLEFKPTGWLSTINQYAESAVAFGIEQKSACWFEFNSLRIEVPLGAAKSDVLAGWQAQMDELSRIYELPENVEKRRIANEERETVRANAFAASVEKFKTMDEKQLRESETPWPQTEAELLSILRVLTDRQQDYGTCVYVMSIAAIAAFNYASSKVGSSGFQASCADLDFLRRSRLIKGPFMISKAEDAIYPQYDLRAKLEKFLEDSKGWLRDESKKLIESSPAAHPNVMAHWKALASAQVIERSTEAK